MRNDLVRTWVLIALVLTVAGLDFAAAQKKDPKRPDFGWDLPDEPFSCEMNAAYLDHLGNRLTEMTTDGRVLIIVSRPGRGENSGAILDRRLHNAVQYYVDHAVIPRQKIVVAKGTRVQDGYGRLEFYLEGRLAGVLLMAKGRDLCVDCCGTGDRNYYPQKSRTRRGRNRN